MSRIFQFTDFKSLNIRLIDQKFEFAGDTSDIKFPTPVSTSIPIKTLVTKGSIRWELPDIGMEFHGLAPSNIFPGPNSVNQTKFKITALEDDTHVHCVQSVRSNERIIYTETDLASNETIDISKGNLVFVFGDNYTVSNTIYSNFRIFAVQNSDVVIQATDACRVIVFTSITG